MPGVKAEGLASKRVRALCESLHAPSASALLPQSSREYIPPGDFFLIKSVERQFQTQCTEHINRQNVLHVAFFLFSFFFFENVASSSVHSWLTANSPEPTQGRVPSPDYVLQSVGGSVCNFLQ